MVKQHCPHCTKTFTQKATLGTHIKEVHDKIKNVKCLLCHYSGTSNEIVRNHTLDVHLACRTLTCDECGKIFTNARRRALIKHKKNMHRLLPQIPCKMCGKIFKNQTGVARHVKLVHNKELKSSCNLCGKSFSSHGNMRKHINVVHLLNM